MIITALISPLPIKGGWALSSTHLSGWAICPVFPQVEGTKPQGDAASSAGSCKSYLARISGHHQCWGSAHGTPRTWAYIYLINLSVIITRTAFYFFRHEQICAFCEGVGYSGPQDSTEVNYPAICMGVSPAWIYKLSWILACSATQSSYPGWKVALIVCQWVLPAMQGRAGSSTKGSLQVQSHHQQITAGSAMSHCESECNNVIAKERKQQNWRLAKERRPKSHQGQIQVSK